MSDCECGAHYLQKCSWWCGLSEKEYKAEHRRRYPQEYIIKELKEQNVYLKKLIELQQGGKKCYK